MNKLKVLDLFSGIGGFSLGLERTGGFETVAFCEIEEFPRRVLAKHWPNVPCFKDVRELKGSDVGTVDVICGGFPCQDISTAGRQAGIAEGTRSGLWSEIVRLVGELRPRYVIVENVANLLRGPSERPGAWFGRVLGDLAECGYDAEWQNIPASALGAHHRRERIWIVAYPSSMQRDGGNDYAAKRLELCTVPKLGNDGWSGNVANAISIGLSGSRPSWNASHPAPRIDWQAVEPFYGRLRHEWGSEPELGRVANGVPNRAHRLKGLGNAVVPQIPELIGHAILAAEAA